MAQRRKNDPEEAAKLAAARAREGEEKHSPEAKAAPVAFTSAERIQALADNEHGDARLIIKALKDQFAFDKQRLEPFRFQGHWSRDKLDDAMKEAHAVLIREYEKEAKLQLKACFDQNNPEEVRKTAQRLHTDLKKRHKSLNTKTRMQSVWSLACTGSGSLAISGDEWNSDPWGLQALGRFIDLRTGQDRPGKPEDYVNKAAPTEWKGLHEEAPAWEAFLQSTFGENESLIRYVQKMLGSALVGIPRQQEFYVLHGAGRNGKGTLLETVKNILGPLAGPVNSEMIMGRQDKGGGANPELLDLQGKRLVWTSETAANQRLNVEKVKLFTGGDTLKGRLNYSNDMIEFSPTHTLFLLTNHKPRVGANEFALWERLRLIPFEFRFVDEPSEESHRKKDPAMQEKLVKERSGILAWLVRGCLLWLKEELKPPREVLEAVREYRIEEDMIQQFVQMWCETGNNQREQAGPLYDAFVRWHKEEYGDNAKVPGKRIFSDGMRTQGFKKDNTKRHTYYVGISVKSEFME